MEFGSLWTTLFQLTYTMTTGLDFTVNGVIVVEDDESRNKQSSTKIMPTINPIV